MNKESIVFTKHAEDMLIERELSKDLVEDVVAHPEWREEGDGAMWYAFRRMEGKVLRVVTKGNNPPTVITMYFDRRLK